MKILIACEFSGVVRNAFAELGHEVWSCDLLDTELPGKHYKCDIKEVLKDHWDLLIAFPPCTHLCVSGARWFKNKKQEQEDAINFFMLFVNSSHIPKIAIENPIGIMSTKYKKPDQIIQPWMFGHGEIKATCFWLKGLPKLKPTEIVKGRNPRVHYASPGINRWKERSKTLSGIAKAMAEQWKI